MQLYKSFTFLTLLFTSFGISEAQASRFGNAEAVRPADGEAVRDGETNRDGNRGSKVPSQSAGSVNRATDGVNMKTGANEGSGPTQRKMETIVLPKKHTDTPPTTTPAKPVEATPSTSGTVAGIGRTDGLDIIKQKLLDIESQRSAKSNKVQSDFINTRLSDEKLFREMSEKFQLGTNKENLESFTSFLSKMDEATLKKLFDADAEYKAIVGKLFTQSKKSGEARLESIAALVKDPSLSRVELETIYNLNSDAIKAYASVVQDLKKSEDLSAKIGEMAAKIKTHYEAVHATEGDSPRVKALKEYHTKLSRAQSDAAKFSPAEISSAHANNPARQEALTRVEEAVQEHLVRDMLDKKLTPEERDYFAANCAKYR